MDEVTVYVPAHGAEIEEYRILLHFGKREPVPVEVVLENIEFLFYGTALVVEVNDLVIPTLSVTGQYR